MSSHLSGHPLATNLYRRFLIMTDAWVGTRANPGSLMVKCHEGGDGRPFFWCGWPDNLPYFYQVFNNERPIYCICGTFSVVKPTHENIRALALYYAAEIVKVQPQGPYLLGGFCEAALTSYEIAKVLLEQGHEVGKLFLVERDVTERDVPLSIIRTGFSFSESLINRVLELIDKPVQCITSVLNSKRRQLLTLFEFFQSKLRVTTSVTPTVQADYKLTPYPEDVTLIFVRWGVLGYFQFGFFQNYWKKLVLGKANFYITKGYSHYNPKNWLAIAEIIRMRILEAGY